VTAKSKNTSFKVSKNTNKSSFRPLFGSTAENKSKSSYHYTDEYKSVKFVAATATISSFIIDSQNNANHLFVIEVTVSAKKSNDTDETIEKNEIQKSVVDFLQLLDSLDNTYESLRKDVTLWIYQTQCNIFSETFVSIVETIQKLKKINNRFLNFIFLNCFISIITLFSADSNFNDKQMIGVILRIYDKAGYSCSGSYKFHRFVLICVVVARLALIFGSRAKQRSER
jgi:molecular chaperone GrpE (heat shock protein)